jgi:hypothetical protein
MHPIIAIVLLDRVHKKSRFMATVSGFLLAINSWILWSPQVQHGTRGRRA